MMKRKHFPVQRTSKPPLSAHEWYWIGNCVTMRSVRWFIFLLPSVFSNFPHFPFHFCIYFNQSRHRKMVESLLLECKAWYFTVSLLSHGWQVIYLIIVRLLSLVSSWVSLQSNVDISSIATAVCCLFSCMKMVIPFSVVRFVVDVLSLWLYSLYLHKLIWYLFVFHGLALVEGC